MDPVGIGRPRGVLRTRLDVQNEIKVVQKRRRFLDVLSVFRPFLRRPFGLGDDFDFILDVYVNHSKKNSARD